MQTMATAVCVTLFALVAISAAQSGELHACMVVHSSLDGLQIPGSHSIAYHDWMN